MVHGPQEEAAEEEAIIELAEFICGHENKHYTGELPLVCDLEPGHEGNHSGECYVIDYKSGGISGEGLRRTEWTDKAGIPADKIKPEPMPQTVEALAREAALKALLEAS